MTTKKNVKKVAKKLVKRGVKKVAKKAVVKKTTLEEVLITLEKWANSNDVDFVGSFASYSTETGEVEDDRIVAFGTKRKLTVIIKELSDLVKAEKEKDINW